MYRRDASLLHTRCIIAKQLSAHSLPRPQRYPQCTCRSVETPAHYPCARFVASPPADRRRKQVRGHHAMQAATKERLLGRVASQPASVSNQ